MLGQDEAGLWSPVLLRKRGAMWYSSSGAHKKKGSCDILPALDYDEYLQLQAISSFDSVGLEQFKMIRKDVSGGRCDASSFTPEWKELLQICQVEKFGEKDYVQEARNEITRVLQA